jgi:hypothetical protein
MELFTMFLAGVGAFGLGGACLLLFYCGMQLNRAIEMNAETIKSTAEVRDMIVEEHKQIQEWILNTNIALETSDKKSAGVREFCAQGYLDMEKKVQRVETAFDELNNSTKFVN